MVTRRDQGGDGRRRAAGPLDARVHLLGPSGLLRGRAGEHRHHGAGAAAGRTRRRWGRGSKAGLDAALGDLPNTGDIRSGKGLLAAVEFVEDRATKKNFDAGLKFAADAAGRDDEARRLHADEAGGPGRIRLLATSCSSRRRSSSPRRKIDRLVAAAHDAVQAVARAVMLAARATASRRACVGDGRVRPAVTDDAAAGALGLPRAGSSSLPTAAAFLDRDVTSNGSTGRIAETGRGRAVSRRATTTRIVAHVAAWPVRLRAARIASSLRRTLIDWASDPEYPGAGIWLMRQMRAKTGLLIATGGT